MGTGNQSPDSRNTAGKVCDLLKASRNADQSIRRQAAIELEQILDEAYIKQLDVTKQVDNSGPTTPDSSELSWDNMDLTDIPPLEQESQDDEEDDVPFANDSLSTAVRKEKGVSTPQPKPRGNVPAPSPKHSTPIAGPSNQPRGQSGTPRREWTYDTTGTPIEVTPVKKPSNQPQRTPPTEWTYDADGTPVKVTTSATERSPDLGNLSEPPNDQEDKTTRTESWVIDPHNVTGRRSTRSRKPPDRYGQQDPPTSSKRSSKHSKPSKPTEKAEKSQSSSTIGPGSKTPGPEGNL